MGPEKNYPPSLWMISSPVNLHNFFRGFFLHACLASSIISPFNLIKSSSLGSMGCRSGPVRRQTKAGGVSTRQAREMEDPVSALPARRRLPSAKAGGSRSPRYSRVIAPAQGGKARHAWPTWSRGVRWLQWIGFLPFFYQMILTDWLIIFVGIAT